MNPQDRITIAIEIMNVLEANKPSDLNLTDTDSIRAWAASILSIVMAAYSSKGDATFVLPK